MTLIIVDKRTQPISLHYEGFLSTEDYVISRNDKKVVELTNFWYGISGSTIYDILFEFIDLYLTKKKANITKLSLYESIVEAQKKLDFELENEEGKPANTLHGFLISKKDNEHYDIQMENNKIIELVINREPYSAYGTRVVPLHLLDAGVSIEKIYNVCSARCFGVGNKYKTVSLPIISEVI